ncbi:MAG: hypothetical protein OEZ40_08555 [Candidatus Bathyarchaeota archaeon]|nr:hypothetical protein [Candidatus Bathyarchaeota archaeon]
MTSGLQDFPVDVQAGGHLVAHDATFLYMAPCVQGYLLPPKRKARAVYRVKMYKQ